MINSILGVFLSLACHLFAEGERDSVTRTCSPKARETRRSPCTRDSVHRREIRCKREMRFSSLSPSANSFALHRRCTGGLERRGGLSARTFYALSVAVLCQLIASLCCPYLLGRFQLGTLSSPSAMR